MVHVLASQGEPLGWLTAALALSVAAVHYLVVERWAAQQRGVAQAVAPGAAGSTAAGFDFVPAHAFVLFVTAALFALLLAALSAVLAWMAEPDPVLAAAAGRAWERMTGLSVEGQRSALPPAADADPIEQDFPVEVWLPDLPRARAQWAEHGARWSAGQRWCRGFDIQTALTSEARRWVDLEAFWDFGARAAFAGTRVFPPSAV